MKTNLDGLFKTDKAQEQEGVVFQLGETTFTMKRFGGFNSPLVRKAMAKYHKPYAKQVEMGTLSFEKEQEIMAKVFVEGSLMGWSGLEVDGEMVDYSKEVAVKLLIELPDLMNTLVEYASNADHYREDLGN